MRIPTISFLIIFVLQLSAREYSFEQITSFDGLSQNNVLAICQDDDGYMWFGTYDGLNRYDGIDFKTYRATGDSSSLSSNLIRTLTTDADRNIWIGTFNQGICKFNQITEAFIQIKNTPKHPNVITSNAIGHVLCDSKKRIWASTVAGINCLIPQADGSYKIIKIQNDPEDPHSLHDNFVQLITEDSKGRIWVSSYQRLELMIMGENDEIQNKFHHISPLQKYVDIRQIYEIDEGILFANYGGVTLLNFEDNNPEKPIFKSYLSAPYFHMQRDWEGNIWIGGHNGVYRFEYNPGNEPLFEVTPIIAQGENEFELSELFIRSMYFDDAGILWFGTNGEGVLKHNTRRSRFRHYKKTDEAGSLSHSKVFTMYEDEAQNVWIGTEGGGINLLEYGSKKDYQNGFKSFDVCPPGEQNFVFDILNVGSPNKPQIWAGVGYLSKLVHMQKRGNDYSPEPILQDITHQVMIMCKDEFGTIWLGTYDGGLAKYMPDKNHLQLFTPDNSGLPTRVIRNIVEDTKGRLWIGTDVGLMVLTRDQKQKENLDFTLFTRDLNDPYSISHSYTVPIVETAKGEIWIGTFGNGINQYHEGTTLTNGTFTHLNMDDGLPNNTIKHIIEDDIGNLWITSNKGLSRIDTSRMQIRNYSIHDGLQDVDFIDLSGCKRHDGEILMGGVKGFNAFYPEEIVQDTLPPRVVFNDLEVMNQRVQVNQKIDYNIILNQTLNLTKEIELKHTQNNFRIYFSAIHYVAPKGNLFRYKLEGFDKEWTTAKSDMRIARYTNLDAGSYIFMVHAANSDGIWTREPKTLIINIKPPFWLTTWFKITLVLTLIGIITGLVVFRFYLMRQRNIVLQNEVERRINQTIEMNRRLQTQADTLKETNTALQERQKQVEEQANVLKVQRDELYSANSIKDKLFYIIAHDLKNPFTTLSGFMDMLHLRYDKYTDDKRKSMILHATRSLSSIQDLLLNLLTWARSQSGTISFTPTDENIIQVISECIDMISLQASEKNINIQFSPEMPELIVNIDEEQIKAVVRNLLTNAVKFTNYQGAIEIRLQNTDSWVTILIEDNGIGIPDEKLTQLFRKDQHVTTRGTSDERGTGLGLITCKDFVEMHKGTITINSVEDKGTLVTIHLPRKQK